MWKIGWSFVLINRAPSGSKMGSVKKRVGAGPRAEKEKKERRRKKKSAKEKRGEKEKLYYSCTFEKLEIEVFCVIRLFNHAIKLSSLVLYLFCHFIIARFFGKGVLVAT